MVLKLKDAGNLYSFSYASQTDQWNVLKDSVDAKYLSTKVVGGFVGSMVALYATSFGTPSASVSYFDWFEYQGTDAVYK